MSVREISVSYASFLLAFQVQLQVEVFFVSDVLLGDDTTELRVRLVRFMEEETPVADD